MLKSKKFIGTYRNPETGRVNRVFACVDERGRKLQCHEKSGNFIAISTSEFRKWRKHR